MNTKTRKHMPTRMCVVCRQKSDKRALIRVVKSGDGVVIDPGGKMNGRGAYLCENRSCWERAMSGDVLSKALRTQISAEDRKRLLQALPS